MHPWGRWIKHARSFHSAPGTYARVEAQIQRRQARQAAPRLGETWNRRLSLHTQRALHATDEPRQRARASPSQSPSWIATPSWRRCASDVGRAAPSASCFIYLPPTPLAVSLCLCPPHGARHNCGLACHDEREQQGLTGNHMPCSDAASRDDIIHKPHGGAPRPWRPAAERHTTTLKRACGAHRELVVGQGHALKVHQLRVLGGEGALRQAASTTHTPNRLPRPNWQK